MTALRFSGILVLGATALFGPAIADDWRHWGEIAGLLCPLSLGVQLVLAGSSRTRVWNPGLVPALLVLLTGTIVSVALDQVAYLMPVAVVVSFAVLVLWIGGPIRAPAD